MVIKQKQFFVRFQRGKSVRDSVECRLSVTFASDMLDHRVLAAGRLLGKVCLSGAFADIFRHLVERDLIVSRTMKVDDGVPDNGSQPAAKASPAAVSREFRLSLTINYFCSVKLNVD